MLTTSIHWKSETRVRLMARTLLTDISIRSLKTPDRGQIVFWDEHLKGFGVRVSQGGSKTFVVQVGPSSKRTLKVLGRFPQTTLAQARKLAVTIKAGVKVAPALIEELTFKEALDRYLQFGTPNMG